MGTAGLFALHTLSQAIRSLLYKIINNYEKSLFLAHLYGRVSHAQGDRFFANNLLIIGFWHIYEVQNCCLCDFHGVAYFSIFLLFRDLSYNPLNFALEILPCAGGQRVKGRGFE